MQKNPYIYPTDLIFTNYLWSDVFLQTVIRYLQKGCDSQPKGYCI